MSPPVKVGAVLMASGSGSRFGSNKLLAQVEGVPLIQRAFHALPSSLFDRAVVVSAYPQILTLAGGLGYHAFENPWAEEGQAASVRLGTAALGDMDGILYAVCDQPYLTTDSIIRLIKAFQESQNAICALSWEGKKGNPVIFPSHLFDELMDLRGDTGGGSVIRAHPDRLLLVEALSPRELRDVDIPEDL